MANVVALNGQPIANPGEPVEDVVALAKHILDLAESGTINALSICIGFADQTFQGKRAGMAISYGMLGVMSAMTHIINEAMTDED